MKNFLLLTCLVSLLVACGPEPATKNEKEIKLYCSGAEYSSDKNHFRASATGKSTNMEIAKKKAYTNVRSTLSSLIQVTVKTVTDNYVKSTEVDDAEAAEARFEELSRQVVNQTLSNTKIICEQPTQDKAGNYRYYVAMEQSADDLVEGLNRRLSADKELKVDYDYEKFKKTFEEEMAKMGQ